MGLLVGKFFGLSMHCYCRILPQYCWSDKKKECRSNSILAKHKHKHKHSVTNPSISGESFSKGMD